MAHHPLGKYALQVLLVDEQLACPLAALVQGEGAVVLAVAALPLDQSTIARSKIWSYLPRRCLAHPVTSMTQVAAEQCIRELVHPHI